jgi:lipopolysaccharide transport protein LptA
LNSGYVWGEDVFLYQFHENGSSQAVLNASRCIVDKVKKTAWCEGHASAVYDNNYLEGCNVFLALDNEKFFLKIFEDAFAVVKNVKLDKSNDAKIDLESASAVYDREEGVIMFDKNVKLFESDRRISCDRAFAFLEGSNTLKRITAVGNVAFSDSSRTGGCPRADYDKSSGKLEMFSSASKTAFIEEFGKNKWKLEGRKIIFWLESEQVEVNNSVITAYDAGGDGKILEGFGR